MLEHIAKPLKTAASKMATSLSPQKTTHSDSDKKITLQILYTLATTPRTFNIDDLSLDVTVADVKAHLEEFHPLRPNAKQQRLIYSGKILSNDRATLASILEPVDVSLHVLLIYFAFSLTNSIGY